MEALCGDPVHPDDGSGRCHGRQKYPPAWRPGFLCSTDFFICQFLFLFFSMRRVAVTTSPAALDLPRSRQWRGSVWSSQAKSLQSKILCVSQGDPGRKVRSGFHTLARGQQAGLCCATCTWGRGDTDHYGRSKNWGWGG